MAFTHLTLTLGCLTRLVASASTEPPLPEFESPQSDYGVKFRYWVPDASVNVSSIQKDIEALVDVGAGGLLFLPFYNYGFGDPLLPSGDDFGFGSPAFNEMLSFASEATRNANLSFDISLGANQGQGVPAESGTPGLATHLVYGSTTVGAGEAFIGQAPEPELEYNFGLSELAPFMHDHHHDLHSKLIAVVAGGVKDAVSREDPNIPGYDFLDVVLDESSLVDLSETVFEGELNWTAPTDCQNYTLFAIYERFTEQLSVDPTEGAETIFGNGSYITDHFSTEGADVAIEFWEEYILYGDLQRELQSSTDHIWEDSLEMSSALWWSYKFLDRFKANRGYDPTRYLPLLFHQSNVLRAQYPPYNTTYVLSADAEESWQSRFLQDYRLTLTEGYREYLKTIERWAQPQGWSFNAQVAYNLPLDMAAAVPNVGNPEVETLAFPSIDLTWQYTGAAHLSGKRVVSSEVGATLTGTYSVSTQELLVLFKDSFAGGVNQVVVHGMAFGGDYLSTWPGFSPAYFGFGEAWGPRRPDWKYMNETLAYSARNQVVLRAGVAKRDVVFYRYDMPWATEAGYEPEDLKAAGFTYEYNGPANFASDEAVVVDGVLAPEGPAYRALVFNDQAYISPEAAIKVLEFAQNGLPIVVIGELPAKVIGSSGQDIVTDAMALVATFDNVKFVTDSQTLPEELGSQGLKPRMSISSESSESSELYSVWRSTCGEDFVFLYNRGDADSFSLTFDVDSVKVPYRFDAWTGERTEVAVFERTDDGLVLSLELAGGQTTVLVFAPTDSCKPHVVSHSENVALIESKSDSEFAVYVQDGEAARVTFSDGKKEEIGALGGDVPMQPLEVGPWDLTIESWVPASQDVGPEIDSAVETIEVGSLDELGPWTETPALRNVSGVGIYTAALSLPETWLDDPRQTSVVIRFGPVLNTIRAWVNDQALPPIDTANPELDITGFLSAEMENTVRVEVASSLFNAVKARSDWILSVGPPLFSENYEEEDQAFGLVGPVTVRPWRKVVVDPGDCAQFETDLLT